jgi:inhibitor of KinA sporulation pathway (predicted exonuclease)
MTQLASTEDKYHKQAIYLDLEWTCWSTVPPAGMKEEIIEVGVVAMDLTDFKLLDEASYFVRPRRWDISQKCTKITGITDQDIRSAKPLSEVLRAVTKRFEPQGKPCCTWGEDVPIFARACGEVRLVSPFGRAIDLSKILQGAFATKDQIGLKAATEMLGLKFDGFAHGALPDARNTALIHASILRRLRTAPDSTGPTPATPEVVPSLSSFAQKLRDSLNKR